MNSTASDPLSAYLDGWLPEDPPLTAARARAHEVGLAPVPPLAGSALRFLAAVTAAQAVAEVGTGTGVSGLWLTRGMRDDGVLTSIDTESEHQRLARQAFADAAVPTARVRLIAGRAQEVLPRLSDEGYDLVHIDTPLQDALDLVPQALRILRPGGVLAISRALAAGRVADSGARDGEAIAARALGQLLRDDESVVPTLLPLAGSDGLLVATRL